MTDILCNWLNNEVKISTKVDATNFAREFCTGFLIGETLHKYMLQDDFDQFSQNRSSESKLNNLTRLEPVLHLLEVPFDTNIAHDVMTETHGTATRLMYQLFIALNKKEKNKLTGAAMETMRPAAPVKLEGVESLIYKERLKHMTPRQTDLNLDALVGRFHEKQIQMESTAFRERFLEEERYNEMLASKRQELLEKYRDNHARKSEMLAKIKAATVHIPKPPPNRTAKAIAQRRAQRRQQEAEAMERDTELFDERLKRTLPPSKKIGATDEMTQARDEVAALPADPLDLIKPTTNEEYIGRIRKRLNEDESAREEREKRRRKVLVDQLKAHEAQEEARREEMLVNRLMRQSQQERRIAVQLLQARHEKEVFRRNRLAQEKEYEARRLAEFEEALNREAEMARLAKLEYIEQTEKDRALHNRIMAEKEEARYKKHYDMCGEVLTDMVDFSSKVAEYRELTNKQLPAKLMRDWKELFVSGLPLYEPTEEVATEPAEPTPEQILAEERQQLLDEGDFEEYRNMIGEWNPPEVCDVKGPPRNNPIVGHIVQRLYNIVHPPTPPPAPPEFPPFPIKACILGKTFSGKTSVARKLAHYHRLEILNVDELVDQAMEAHKNGEVVEIEPEEEEMTIPGTDTVMTVGDGEESQVAGTVVSSSQAQGTDHQDLESSMNASKFGSAKRSEGQLDTNRTGEDRPSTTLTSQMEDGAEKTDPEKPVPPGDEAEEAASENPLVKSAVPSQTLTGPAPSSRKNTPSSKRRPKTRDKKPEATLRAKLGAKALRFLKRGRPMEDSLQVDILVEAVRRLPEGTGWVLDGFPCTYSQAKLLEKAMSGFEAASREPSKINLKASKGKNSKLAPDPRPVPPPPEASSGINVVVLFDLDNDLCLKRSAGRSYASQSDEQYHQEFKPPPDGSATGIGKQERVIPVEDPAHDQEQIQHRMTVFQESWPKMEKWFTRFGTLKKVDATKEAETVFLEVENILEETVRKLTAKDEEDVLQVEEPIAKEEEKPAEPEKPAEAPVEPTPEEKDRSRPASKKGSSRGGSGKRSGSRGSADKKSKRSAGSRSPGKESSDKKSAKSSRGSSPKSPKSRRSGKKGKTPEPEPEPEPEAPPGTPPPQPGSDEWDYVDQTLDEELAHILAPNWDAIENAYIGNSKQVFRNIRDERERIIKYFYQIRKSYLEYLRRPDAKQEFVSQWQKDFNDISEDLRSDEEMHGELHQRVDDLRERLWTICDERKEQAESEREAVVSDGWVDDRLGILSNHYITQMQAEVDRFQDTVRMLKDYYRGMEGKIPDELSNEYIRIPLVELPVTERVASPAKSEASETAVAGTKAKSPSNPTSPAPLDSAMDAKSSPSKSGTPSGKRGKKGVESTEATPAALEPDGEGVDEPKRPKIPLVPRRPLSPDAAAAGGGGAKVKGDKAKDKGKGKELPEDAPPPPSDPDERLLYDAHQAGLTAIDKVLAAEQAAREAEEEAEREREQQRELEKQRAAVEAKKKGKKDKGGKKSRSPSPKKGKGSSTPQPTPPPSSQEPETEEEREKKMLKEKARMEFYAAMQEEALGSKARLELIRQVAALVQQDLKQKADSAYKEMHDWLGARFLKEMESIDHLSEVARNAIEDGDKLREEMLIAQEDFLVCEDVKVLRTPSPIQRPPPTEMVMAEAFTVDQVMMIYNQFKLTAPTGMLSLKAFQDTFQDLTALTHGTEQIPDIWMNIPQEKLELMSSQLSPDGEYIDWRAFLLQASHPWPVPTQTELLDTLQRFHDMDQKATGCVTREQFDRVELWFRGSSNAPPTPVDPAEPLPYDRLENLKEAFFDVFADHTVEPSQLDYVSMLLYFSIAPEAYEGLLRALSVASGTHMPRLPRLSNNKKLSRPPSQASLAVSMEMDGDKEDPIIAALTEDIPESAITAEVPLDALDRVLHHGQCMRGDSHRFSVTSNPEDAYSRERLAGVYQELGSDTMDSMTFANLIEHPVIQDIVSCLNTFKALDLRAFLSNPGPDTLDVQSLKTAD